MEISGDVTDAGRTTNEHGKIGLLSLWMLDAEFRNNFQKGEDGNPPGITTPREDDDSYPDLPTRPPRGRYSLQTMA